MARASRRRRVEPTDDWEQLKLLCLWPEQRDYELIRPLVLFGSPASERAQQTGAASERTAAERYGSPEALVTDGAKIFRAKQATYVYESLGIAKHEIESGRPWQSYIETTFNIQRRMADFHFAKAES